MARRVVFSSIRLSLIRSTLLSTVFGTVIFSIFLTAMTVSARGIEDGPAIAGVPQEAGLNSQSANSLPANSLPANPVVVRVYFPNQAMVNRLATEVDVWTVEHDEGYLVAMVDEAGLALLDHLELAYEIDDLEMRKVEALATQREQVTAANSPFGFMAGIPGYACYRTVEETYADMAALADAYPNLVELKDIGDTWDKITPGGAEGYDIEALVVTNRANQAANQPANQIAKPRIFIVAAVHARELSTSELTMRFAEMLVDKYDTDPNIKWLLDYTEVHLVPHANPDGRKQAENLVLWRKNRNLVDGDCTVSQPSASTHGGVDLNRNSSFKWNACLPGQGCSSNNSCTQTYRGAGPASEPETQALEAYMSSIFSDTRPSSVTEPAAPDTAGVMLTLHSYSELIIFPWGYSAEPAPNGTELTTLGRKFGYFTGYEVCQSGSQSCIYQTDGTNDDWAYGELGVAAYTFELGTSFFQACEFFDNNILVKNMDALVYAAKVARLPYQLPAGPEVVEIDLGPTSVISTTFFTMTAVADDTRYDSNGPWGDEPTQVISAARYSVDTPSWITGTQTYSMSVADASLNSDIEEMQAVINTAGWRPGKYTLFVEAQDADGNWGIPLAQTFVISRSQYDSELTPDVTKTSVNLGQNADYVLTLTNWGWAADLYTLTITSTWPISYPSSTISVEAGQSVEVELTVRTPPTVTQALLSTPAISNTINVVAESHSTDAKVELLDLTTVASPYRHHLPIFLIPQSQFAIHH